MSSLRGNVHVARIAMRGFREKTEMGHSISGRMKYALSRLRRSVDEIIATMHSIEGFTVRIEEAIDVKWPDLDPPTTVTPS